MPLTIVGQSHVQPSVCPYSVVVCWHSYWSVKSDQSQGSDSLPPPQHIPKFSLKPFFFHILLSAIQYSVNGNRRFIGEVQVLLDIAINNHFNVPVIYFLTKHSGSVSEYDVGVLLSSPPPLPSSPSPSPSFLDNFLEEV